jgi:hypothetical protein
MEHELKIINDILIIEFCFPRPVRGMALTSSAGICEYRRLRVDFALVTTELRFNFRGEEWQSFQLLDRNAVLRTGRSGGYVRANFGNCRVASLP